MPHIRSDLQQIETPLGKILSNNDIAYQSVEAGLNIPMLYEKRKKFGLFTKDRLIRCDPDGRFFVHVTLGSKNNPTV